MSQRPDLIGLEDGGELRERFPEDTHLNHKQLKFIAHVLNGNTFTASYLFAYPEYNGAYPHTMGSFVANQPAVKAVLDREMSKARQLATSHASKNVPRILDEYLRLAFVDPAKLLDNTGRPLPLSEIDEDTRRAIIGLEVVDEFEGRGEQRQQIGTVKKYKLADKQRALDSLSKVLGLLVEKQEVTGKDGTPLVPAQEMDEKQLARRIAFILQKAAKPEA
jgi:phage terminase small subunit